MHRILTITMLSAAIICYEVCRERIEYEPEIDQHFHDKAFEYAIKQKRLNDAAAILSHKLKQLHIRSYLQQAQARAISTDLSCLVSKELHNIWLFICTDLDSHTSEEYRLRSLHDKLLIAEHRMYHIVAAHKQPFARTRLHFDISSYNSFNLEYSSKDSPCSALAITSRGFAPYNQSASIESK